MDEGIDQILHDVINTNLVGLLLCTKAAYRLLEKNDDYGHIINMNSVYGHTVIPFQQNTAPRLNIYPGTKHAVTATTEVIRLELNAKKNKKVKISVRILQILSIYFNKIQNHLLFTLLVYV